MRLSLRSKATLLITSLVLILVAAAGGWQYRQVSADYARLMREQQQALTDVAAADLDYRLGAHLASLSRSAQYMDTGRISDTAVQQRFIAASGLRALFDGVALVAVGGTVLVSEPPSAAGLKVADRDYFIRALAGEAVISQPLLSRTRGRPLVSLAVPVLNAEGRVVAVLTGLLDLQRPNVLGDMSRREPGNGGYYVIVTRGASPLVVMHPDSALLLKPAGAQQAGAEAGSADLVTQALVRGADWDLRVVVPAQAAYAPVAHARQTMLVQMFWLGGGCALLVWLAASWLMRPLTSLAAAIRALRRSPDSLIALDLRANDERGDLAREFDELMRELRDQRSQVAAVTDASPLGLFRCDTDGLLTYVNDTYLQIHGLPREEAAQGWLGLVREDIRERIGAEWRRLMRLDAPVEVLRKLHRPDGSSLLVRLRSRPLHEQGRLVGHVGTLADVTERMQAQRALRDSEHRLRLVTDNLPVLISYLDRDLRFRFVNETYRHWFGPDAAPTLGHTVREYYGDAAWADIAPWLRTALGGEPVAYERELQRPDGLRQVHVTLVPDRDELGEVIGLFTLIADITPYRETERALQLSEARLRTVADALPMRVAYIDADERYRFNNRAHEESFGLTREQIQGRGVRELLGDAAYRAIEPHIRQVLRGEAVSFQDEINQAGRYVCYEAQYIPQFAADGQTVLGFHAVISDITRQKLEERRLVNLARIDKLTGLVNRAGFETGLAEAMARSRAAGTLMGLLFLDIDHFKRVNDGLGHLSGDALLQAFATRLSRSVRSTDTVARPGGDEFTVIMEGLPQPEVAATVAGKIVSAMREPFEIDDEAVAVSTSIGLAFYRGGATSAAELLRQADQMLYEAKAAGRDRCEVAWPRPAAEGRDAGNLPVSESSAATPKPAR